MAQQINVATNEKGLALYVVNMVNVFEPGNVAAQCNSIIFVNKGTSVAIVDGLPLNPQQSLEIPGNRYEWDNTNYIVSFDTTSGTINSLYVIRKVYQVTS